MLPDRGPRTGYSRRIASIIRGTDDLDLVVDASQMSQAIEASSFVRSARMRGVVAEALERRAAMMRGPVLSSLRALRSAFEGDGSPGPAGVVNAARAELPGLRFDDDLELEVRALARDAVRTLLRGPLE